MSERRVIPRESLTYLHRGRFNSLVLMDTAAGPREVLVHNPEKSNWLASKMLLLSLKAGKTLRQAAEFTDTLPSLVETLTLTGLHSFEVTILAADRPVAYGEFPIELAANYQLEFPGGLSKKGEKPLGTAMRETLEEAGLVSGSAFVQTAPLVDFPAANDAGSNMELYTAYVALVNQRPQPPRREGIIPEKCWTGPLLEAENFLRQEGQRGVVVEWLAWAMLQQLGFALAGSWSTLRETIGYESFDAHRRAKPLCHEYTFSAPSNELFVRALKNVLENRAINFEDSERPGVLRTSTPVTDEMLTQARDIVFHDTVR
jgi:8-oxo-dGTP pyrophosphatase MutT (NUDIX family)